MDNKYIHKLINNGSYMLALRKRIKFINKNGLQGTNAGMASALFTFQEQDLEYFKNFNGVLLTKK